MIGKVKIATTGLWRLVLTFGAEVYVFWITSSKLFQKNMSEGAIDEYMSLPAQECE